MVGVAAAAVISRRLGDDLPLPWVSGHTLQESNEGPECKGSPAGIRGLCERETTEVSNLVTPNTEGRGPVLSVCVCL